MGARILVGTASWSDPEFVRDWYPPGLPARERLPFYAAQFEMVELNSSFYAVPEARQVDQWVRATPPGFLFDVKLHKLLSRHACEAKFLPKALQKSSAGSGKRVQLTPELEAAVCDQFLRGISPFVTAGKLGALLLQLSPAFRPRENRLDELEGLLARLTGYRVAVELRNRHWLIDEQFEQTLAFFRDQRVTLVSVDAPVSEHFTVMPAVDEVTNPEFAYLRLHGRSERAYITGKTVAERFDYDYSDAELAEVAARVETLSPAASVVHVVFNNNRSHYAPTAALRFRKQIGQAVPATALPTRPKRARQQTLGLEE